MRVRHGAWAWREARYRFPADFTDTDDHPRASPTGGECRPPPSKGTAGPRSPTRPPKQKKNSEDPPPVGKAGFEVWVLTKGGLVT